MGVDVFSGADGGLSVVAVLYQFFLGVIMSQMKRVVEMVLCMYKEGDDPRVIQKYLDRQGVNQSVAEIVGIVNTPYSNKWEDFSQTCWQTHK